MDYSRFQGIGRSKDSSQEAQRSLGIQGFPGASGAFCANGEIPPTCVSLQRCSPLGGLDGFQKCVQVKSQRLSRVCKEVR